MHNNSDPATVRSGEQTAAQPPRVNAAVEESERKAFVFYSNWYSDCALSLSEEEQGRFFLILIRYACQGIVPGENVPATLRTMFGLVRPAIDADLQKYDKIVETNRKRAEKRKMQAAEKNGARCAENQCNSPEKPIINNQQSEISNQQSILGKEKEEEAHPRFSEVQDYWREHNFKSAVREFFDYYDARDWLNHKGEHMQSWKKAAVMWEDKFRRDVLPMRRREQAAEAAMHKAHQAAERENIRTAVRQDREAEADRRAATAVTPEVAKRMYEEALRLCAGNDDAALALLQRADDDPVLRQRLAGG